MMMVMLGILMLMMMISCASVHLSYKCSSVYTRVRLCASVCVCVRLRPGGGLHHMQAGTAIGQLGPQQRHLEGAGRGLGVCMGGASWVMHEQCIAVYRF